MPALTRSQSRRRSERTILTCTVDPDLIDKNRHARFSPQLVQTVDAKFMDPNEREQTQELPSLRLTISFATPPTSVCPAIPVLLYSLLAHTRCKY